MSRPDIEQEYMSNTYHHSEKSREYNHSFVLYQFHNRTDIIPADKHGYTHNDKHYTPELC